MRVNPQQLRTFCQVMQTSDPGKRKEMLASLGLRHSDIQAFNVPVVKMYQTHGKAFDVRSRNQDRDELPDSNDPNPFDADANRDLVTDGLDPRLDAKRDVDRDGVVNGKDAKPFDNDIS